MTTTWPEPWTLKPTYDDLRTGEEIGSDVPDDIHWSLSLGFALNFNHADQDDPTSPVAFEAHFSDADLARGMVKREVTPEQMERLALLLMAKAARVRQEVRQ